MKQTQSLRALWTYGLPKRSLYVFELPGIQLEGRFGSLSLLGFFEGVGSRVEDQTESPLSVREVRVLNQVTIAGFRTDSSSWV